MSSTVELKTEKHQPKAAPASTSRPFGERLQGWLFRPLDHASFTFFRIAFGILMMVEVYRYFDHGWIKRYWIDPPFLFKYYGFSWVDPLPGNGLYIVWGVLAIAAFFITVGLFYRASAAVFFLGITYTFLLCQSTYLNHMYLICLLSFLLIFVPANRAWALDTQIGLAKRSRTIPAWALYIFLFQFSVVYFYGGIAKFAPDWLRGQPMGRWIAGQTHLPILGPWVDTEWMPLALSYGGLLLDLLIAPALLWRRTRPFAFVAALLFHFLNAKMFHIGIFPWLAAAATFLFLPPNWPRRLLAFCLATWHALKRMAGKASATSARWKQWPILQSPAETGRGGGSLALPGRGKQMALLTFLGIYVAIQLLVPLRHYLYPGTADWTYEGHRFSWRMKLHDRSSRARFYIIDPNTGMEGAVNPHRVLQRRQASKMASRPDMILQFAHYIAEKTPRLGQHPIRVEARVMSSLNGRKPQDLVKPGFDLAATPRSLKPVDWLVPLKEPLPEQQAAPKKARPKPQNTESEEAETE